MSRIDDGTDKNGKKIRIKNRIEIKEEEWWIHNGKIS